METTKKDYVEVYVTASLNEIKNEVKREINLQEERMHETDEVMKRILEDLINGEYKNIQKAPEGNLIYTLLPLSDRQEHKKIRDTLTLLYTSIYFNNVSLLKKLLASEVKLIYYDRLSHDYDRLALSLLDSTITSRFTEEEYLEILKKHKSVFDKFYQTIIKPNDQDLNIYLERFAKILKEIKIPLDTIDARNLFQKKRMAIYEDETYLLANKDQLTFLSNTYLGEEETPESIKHFNRLIKTTDFSSIYANYDIMFKLFTDEELIEKKWGYSESLFYQYFTKYDSSEILNKAYDLYQKYPKITDIINRGAMHTSWKRLNIDLIATIDNDILISMLEDGLNLNRTPEEMKKLLIAYKPKMLVKRLFKNNKERSE